MNRALVALSVLCLSGAAGAHEAPGTVVVERTFQRASELMPWCRAEAEARVVAAGGTPYQWTASYHDRGRMLHVDGRLRVDGADMTVQCRSARGAREREVDVRLGTLDA